MADKKIIAVVGATGAQGGGLVRAIAADPNGGFTARAITRNVDSEKARALAALGAEVVAADITDVESLKKAFAGAHGVYCVTFFWDHLSTDIEKQHADNMAEAAQQTGAKHVIWSTFEDTRKWVPLNDDRMPTLMERYKVPHFDAKAEADASFTRRGVPTTFLLTSFYWDNLIHFGMAPRKDESGRLVFTLPMGDKKLPGIAAEDIGKVAYGVFKKGSELIGKTVGAAGGHPTGAEMASSLGRALGQEVHYQAVPPAVFRSFGFPGAEDLGNMFQFKADFEHDYCAARDLGVSRSLGGNVMTFDDWLAKYGRQIPIQ